MRPLARVILFAHVAAVRWSAAVVAVFLASGGPCRRPSVPPASGALQPAAARRRAARSSRLRPTGERRAPAACVPPLLRAICAPAACVACVLPASVALRPPAPRRCSAPPAPRSSSRLRPAARGERRETRGGRRRRRRREEEEKEASRHGGRGVQGLGARVPRTGLGGHDFVSVRNFLDFFNR
jgi:hypothetical protein